MAKKKQAGPTGYDAILGQIQDGSLDSQHDRLKRKRLLKKLEQTGSTEPRPRRVAMYYSSMARSISPVDILPFTSMLKSIGKTENLDLIIHSPGGDGLTAEKMIDLSRRYCSGEFRVVVPVYAKSAATLVALGADTILMGETSELGPIDAQVFIIQDGLEQQVSADHFIRAEAEAKKALTAKKGVRGYPEREGGNQADFRSSLGYLNSACL
jgi:ClpP class serine protease